jgi:phage tail sheath protein FI
MAAVTLKTPGVYVQEIPTLAPSVAEVPTAIPAFIGCTANGPTPDGDGKIVPIVQRIASRFEYEPLFGSASPSAFTVTSDANGTLMETITRESPDYEYLLYYSMSLYARNGGGACYIISIGNYDTPPTKAQFEAGLAALEKEDEPTLILLTDAINLAAEDYYSLCQQALVQCAKLGDRFAILDVLNGDVEQFRQKIGMAHLKYGAAYHPYLQTSLVYQYTADKVSVTMGGTTTTLAAMETSDPPSHNALYNQIKAALTQQRVILPPSSAVAGVYARVDGARGVWKAPANESVLEVIGPIAKITHEEQESLNIDPTAGKSINAIRAFTGKGTLVWGARTLAGNDNEWRYIPVRRLFNLVEESVQKSTSFAVFEPNDPTTWLKVRAVIESYLYGLWQQGALVGPTPDAAYFVNVGLGKTMTTQDVLEGRLIVELGLAAVRPAEFIVLKFMHKLQQA